MRYPLVAFAICCIGLACDDPTTPTGDDPATTPDWDDIRANDTAHVPPGWSPAVRLAVNDDNWEDGAYISRDGGELYFTYYPGPDLIADMGAGDFVDDLDVYVSDYPFATKTRFTESHLSEDIWSEGGVMFSQSGDLFYHSNRDWLNDQKSDEDIYKGEERLPFNGDERFGNPHYCEALDELFFDQEDTRIYRIQGAAAGDFSGTPELLGPPINANGSSSFQPFLTPDGQTMYWTTNRGDIPIPGVSGPAIYRSLRSGDDWTEPELFIYGKTGAGEPTLTADGKKLYFIQLFYDAASESYTSDIFMTEWLDGG